MEKMDMMSMDRVQENITKIRALFPECVTEVKRDGKVTLAVDFDELKQEMSGMLIDEREERYQMTWPDKRKAKLLANTSISATLRPCKEESVDFDNTQNLYIEGDNLDVLKLLQETYLGKVKMIYIDPPYNTGSDFVYEDDFAQSVEEYVANSGQYDNQGNRLVENNETNGRFHTDWLNMIYPRLKVARDLLTDDGVIFISCDDHEQANLKKVCDEVFGEFLNDFIWINNLKGRQISKGGAVKTYEHILCYAKYKDSACKFIGRAATLQGDMPLAYRNQQYDILSDEKGEFVIKNELYNTNSAFNEKTRPNLVFNVLYDGKTGEILLKDLSDEITEEERGRYVIFYPHKNNDPQYKYHAWRWSKEKILKEREELYFDCNNAKIYTKIRNYAATSIKDIITNIGNGNGEQEKIFGQCYFSYPKSVKLLKLLCSSVVEKNDLVCDFFSGSATTAHAVMQLNAEDGGNRKFIMVQLPELCNEQSAAYKEGYKNICEIGKERIRRAGKIIKENINALRPVVDEITDYEKETGQIRVARTWGNGITGRTNYAANATETFIDAKTGQRITHEYEETDPKDHYRFHPEDLDVGFRVLKLDSSNMKDVYYKAEDYAQTMIAGLEDNVKEDRTPLDLLFQVMLDLGQELSAKIEEKTIAGKTVWCVEGNNIIACFDSDINDQVVTEIAKLKPLYAVFRDSSFVSDAAAANCEQIFASISPATSRKVI